MSPVGIYFLSRCTITRLGYISGPARPVVFPAELWSSWVVQIVEMSRLHG